MKRLLFIVQFLLLSALAFADIRAQGDCMQGSYTVSTNSIPSTTRVMRSFVNLTGTTPTSGCTVTVYVTGSGGTLATIYSDNSGTPLANPFVADSKGHWFFYGSGRFDVTMLGAGIPSPFTLSDIKLLDIISVTDFGAVCDWNGASGIDNTTAFQDAVNSVASGGGGVLYFPAGRCAFSGAVTIPPTVYLQGEMGAEGTAATQLTYTGNPSIPTAALVFSGASTVNAHGGMGGIGLTASNTGNANSIGIYLGGDPSSVIAPAANYGNLLRFEYNYIQGFGVGTQYGNNAFLNEWRSNIWNFNGIQIYAPTGLTNSGDTEKYFGGLLTNGINGGLKLGGEFLISFFGTEFDFNSIYQVNLDTTDFFCYGCAWEGISEIGSSGSGSGYPITVWGTKSPNIHLYGGTVFYDCSSVTQSEYFNLSGGGTITFEAYGLKTGSFSGCAATSIVTATGLTNAAGSSISLRRASTNSGVTVTPIVSDAYYVYVESLGGGVCHNCDGTAFADQVTKGEQFNSVPLLFGPDGASNTSAYDVGIAHFLDTGTLAVYSGPPTIGGIDQNLKALATGALLNSFNSPTSTPALSSVIQGELYQRNQAAFGKGRQRICAGDPSADPFRTCFDLEANSAEAPSGHNKITHYVLGTAIATESNYGYFVNGLGTKQRTVTSSSALGVTDSTIFCNANSGVVSLTLPAVDTNNAGRIYVIKKMDASANACSVGSSGGTVEGGATLSITGQYTTKSIQNDGTNWWVIAH